MMSSARSMRPQLTMEVERCVCNLRVWDCACRGSSKRVLCLRERGAVEGVEALEQIGLAVGCWDKACVCWRQVGGLDIVASTCRGASRAALVDGLHIVQA